MTLDFNIKANNIECSDPISPDELQKFKNQTNIVLPPSFINFKNIAGDSFYISSGNALSIFPLNEDKDSFTNMIDISKDYAHLGNILESYGLLVFGMSGVDSETWAFYVKKMNPLGEFPIVWLSPAEERFFLHSTNFESFINIQYHALSADDDIDDYDSYYTALVERYDNGIRPFDYNSIYNEAIELSALHSILKNEKENGP